ncbi:MAG TPA: hypothetical protein VE871_00185 [Longimicrobium sp.]|nr:hypothetical protein [Longimicrobium sp.]
MSRPAGFGVPAVVHASPGIPLAAVTCPRCGFQGPTVSYFSQGGHIAALVLLAAMTSPLMASGGILYFLLRHNHRSCARCGETLGRGDMLALQSSAAGGTPLSAMMAAEGDLPEDGGGSRKWSVGAWALFAFAAMMLMIGVAELEFVPFLFGALSAAGGVGLLSAGRRAREERRGALLAALQQPVLRLAGEQDGRLTVTEVASALNWPMRRAEKVLNSLEDGLRVSSDVTREGVIVYEFRELMHSGQKSLAAEEMDLLLGSAPAPPRHEAAQAHPQPRAEAIPAHPQPRADAFPAQPQPRAEAAQLQPPSRAADATQLQSPFRAADATQLQSPSRAADATQLQPPRVPDATQLQSPRVDATQLQPSSLSDATQAQPQPLPQDGTLRL